MTCSNRQTVVLPNCASAVASSTQRRSAHSSLLRSASPNNSIGSLQTRGLLRIPSCERLHGPLSRRLSGRGDATTMGLGLVDRPERAEGFGTWRSTAGRRRVCRPLQSEFDFDSGGGDAHLQPPTGRYAGQRDLGVWRSWPSKGDGHQRYSACDDRQVLSE